MNPKTIIFIGRSGCGKGTQIEKLISYLKENESSPSVFHLEAGQRFRDFIKEEKSDAQKLAKIISDDGGLQPEFLSVWAWGSELAHKFENQDHLFIDGTPRRVSEAKILESALDFFDRRDVHIIYIKVSRDWSILRMQNRGRHDDKDLKDIQARLDWFDENVVPVLDYFRAHKFYNFHEINGEQEIDFVHKNILKELDLK